MPFSNHVLDKFIGHNISQLTECNAPDLSHLNASWLDGFILNSIVNVRFEHPQKQYIFNFLRRAEAAFHEYKNARTYLCRYIETDSPYRNPDWSLYFQSILHFEQSIAQSYQALEFLVTLLNDKASEEIKLFNKNDNSIYQRLNTIYNTSKHMDGKISAMPESATVALWLSNNGIECKETSLAFEELKKIFEKIAEYANKLSIIESNNT